MDLPQPSLEPNASREPETLGKDDQDWMSALRESVSFGRFLSESLEWDTMRHVLPRHRRLPYCMTNRCRQPGSIKMYRSISRCRPQWSEVGAQSASSNCGAACIGDSGAGVSCSPCLPAARPSTNIEGAALHLNAG